MAAADIYAEAGKAIIAAITRNAELSGDPKISSSASRAHAEAVNQLCEALAWVRSPGQSHGGGTTVVASK